MSDNQKPTEAYLQRKRRTFVELRPSGPRKQTFALKTVLLLLKAVVVPVVWLMKILIGSWLSPLLNRRFERQLMEAVRKNLSFLFDKFGARFVPDDSKRKLHNFVILETDKLRFKVSLFRGRYCMELAPLQAPLDWEDLGAMLMITPMHGEVYTGSDLPKIPSWSNLAELGKVLELHLPSTEEALSPSQYPETIRRLERIEEIGRDEFVQRWKEGVQFYRQHPEAVSANKEPKLQTLGLRNYTEL
jgi:hypothetical protein